MSGMGGKLNYVLQLALHMMSQIVTSMLCHQLSQLNLGQVCVSAWLSSVKQATPSNCGKTLLCHWYRSGVERLAQQHLGETQGYGKNPMNRGNPQPNPNDDAQAHLGTQFRDLMSVGQQRFEERTNKFSMSWHKIKSVPLETRFERGIMRGRYPNHKESFKGL